MKNIVNNLEEFIFGVGKLKKVKKDLFKALTTLVAIIIILILIGVNIVLKNYLRAGMYTLTSCFLILMFIKFANDYYISKFISQFTK
jgi:Flp pilus assembly protein TadB